MTAAAANEDKPLKPVPWVRRRAYRGTVSLRSFIEPVPAIAGASCHACKEEVG